MQFSFQWVHGVNMFRILMTTGMLFFVLVATAVGEDYPLSLQLQELERDLASADYAAVLKTMIHTDLAAEWQRIATPDNCLLFAREHGGIEQVEKVPDLKAAYERRKQIATKFLELIRGAYEL